MYLPILWQEIKRSLRDPAGYIISLALPMALTLALGLVADKVPFGPPPEDGFDALSYMAPGMALFFMMFSVRQAAKIMAEDGSNGLRDRLCVAPVSEMTIIAARSSAQILVLFLQILVLVGSSSLMYGLKWGSSLPVLLTCLAIALAGGGWIFFLFGVGRSPERIGSLGMAISLVFAIASRSFAAVSPSAPWLDGFARITPNYWGLHAFSSLALEGDLGSIAPDLIALVAMFAILLFAAKIVSSARLARGNR